MKTVPQRTPLPLINRRDPRVSAIMYLLLLVFNNITYMYVVGSLVSLYFYIIHRQLTLSSHPEMLSMEY